MRILCLHGYRQSGKTFREKTGAFRKLVKTMPSGKGVEFDFLDAPHPVEVKDDDNNSFCLGGRSSEPAQRAWWFSKFPGTFSASEPSEWEQGLQESIELVIKELRTRDRYDGLLGFSQGAALAFMVLRRMETSGDTCKPYFAVLFAPFKSPNLAHEAYYASPVRTPCLVVSGETDQVIPRAMTETLLPLFSRLSFIGHPAGHIVPAKAELKAKYVDFLAMFDRKST